MHTLTVFRSGIGLLTARVWEGTEWRVVANDYCFPLRCPVPSFETCVPGAGQATSCDRTRGGSRGKEKRVKTTRGHTTRPIATGRELRFRGWKGNKIPESNKQTTLCLRYLPTRARRGVTLPRSALVLNLTAGRGYGEDGPTLLFHARPDDRPQVCVFGGYIIFPKRVMLRIRIPRHTHTLAHTLTHYAHVGPVTRIHAGI